MKGPENHTEEYAFLSHYADNDPGKKWQRVGTRMKTMKTHDPRPKASMLREYNLGFCTNLSA